MAILNKIYILPVMLLLTGCYETFDPAAESKPVLCMNSIITAGEPIEVSVTKTWRFNDPARDEGHEINDADISIFANGLPASPDYIPREGDRIMIVASTPAYGSARAQVTVPKAPSVGRLTARPTAVSVWNDPLEGLAMNGGIGFNMTVEMEVLDNRGDVPDYFHLRYFSFPAYDASDLPEDWSRPEPAHLSTGSFEYESEPIFSEHIGELDKISGADAYGFTFFTDRQFSGKSYTLHLRFGSMSYSVYSEEFDPDLYDCGITFDLWSVSESLYNWAIYSWQADNGVIGDLGDIGFGDPVWGYSNVSTGAGIVAARTKATCSVNLKDFIRQTLSPAN